MGIEEAILQEVREQGEQEGLQKGLQDGLQKGELQAKIKSIQKALLRGKLTLQEITEDFEVSLDFIQKIQKGEMK